MELKVYFSTEFFMDRTSLHPYCALTEDSKTDKKGQSLELLFEIVFGPRVRIPGYWFQWSNQEAL